LAPTTARCRSIPGEHIDIVNGLVISAADKEKILWCNAARFFGLDNLA